MLCRLAISQQRCHLHILKSAINKHNYLNPNYVHRRAKSNIWPISDFLGKPSMFSLVTIKKHYETIPLIVISLMGLTCEFLWIARQTITRDDVRYCTKSCLMAFERNIDTIEKGDKPPIRKFYVRNQKYEYADSLVDALAALREPTEEEKAAMEEDAKKNKK